MERSRSKRNYYYDQDYDSQAAAAAAAAAAMPRTKQRFHHNNNNNNNNHHYNNNNHRRGGGAGRMVKSQQDGGGGGGGGGGGASPTLTTSYRILCHDIKAGGVIGKSGSIIKAIRQETGAWINVHQLIPGDEERIIEISEARRRDPDGRIPAFSPAQEALMMIHERIIESDAGFGFAFDAGSDESDEFGPRGGAGRVATRLVVAKANVGCLLGKGGKIIEQMRIETKTQIRILPRDHTLPQCVSMSEEIVQVVGDVIAVKKALGIISARLRESQLRDRSHFHGRSQDQFFPQDDDFAPHMNNMSRRGSLDGPPLGPRFPSGLTNARSNSFGSRSSGYGFESGTSPMDDQAQAFHVEDLVFQILCPNGMVDRVMGEKDGIIEMLRVDIGVDVRVTDPVLGSEERIIVISSDEGPNDDLFPAQEALLHIQSKIVDLGPDKDNIITTRLLVPSSEISCLEGRDGSLSDMEKLSGANIKILPKEDFPICALGPDELVQIVGEITAARDALVEITSRLRSYLFREVSFPKDLPPPPSIPTPGYGGSISGAEVVSLSPNKNPTREGYQGSEIPIVGHQNVQTATTLWPSKDVVAPVSFPVDRKENDGHEEPPSGLNRLSVPLVTRSILEVVIPEHAISKLTMRSGNKLAQISELSGATVRLVEDRPEPEKVIQISGTPEQAERAQSLLQGFILSTQEDAPSS